MKNAGKWKLEFSGESTAARMSACQRIVKTKKIAVAGLLLRVSVIVW